MKKRQFKPEERYAVYTVHGEKRYLCATPIDLVSMEVDHLILESGGVRVVLQQARIVR